MDTEAVLHPFLFYKDNFLGHDVGYDAVWVESLKPVRDWSLPLNLNNLSYLTDKINKKFKEQSCRNTVDLLEWYYDVCTRCKIEPC